MTDLNNLPYDCKCPACGRPMFCRPWVKLFGETARFQMVCSWWLDRDRQTCGLAGPIRDSEHGALLAMELLTKGKP
jgi:hypothetical protein